MKTVSVLLALAGSAGSASAFVPYASQTKKVLLARDGPADVMLSDLGTGITLSTYF